MKRSLHQRLCAAAVVGTALATSALAFGATAASASGIAPPLNNSTAATSGANAYRFNPSTVQGIRSTGSDTTFYMMQSIADLYNQAALYGCTLASDDDSCTTADDANTDTVDNFSRTEVQNGIDAVGSGAGLAQLCQESSLGSVGIPAGLRVDFVRSSTDPVAKTAGGCPGITGMGYAADGVPAVDFPTVNPSVYGATVVCNTAFQATCAANAAFDGWNATAGTVAMGPVAAGWLPGDNPAGPYSGTAFTNLPNNDATGTVSSTAYRIWCGGKNRITDWGQLTNLSAANNGGTAAKVGYGAPIGVPITVWGVNPGSGTLSVFNSWAASGATSPDSGCAKNATTPTAGAPGVGNASDIALENNAAQLSQIAAADNGVVSIPGYTPDNPYGTFGGTTGGIAGEAAEVAGGLYYMSYGVATSNNYASSTTINGTTYPAQLLKENGITDSSHANTTENAAQKYPTARLLYNAYLSSTVRASTANFLNWICDDDTNFQKGTDNATGVNYDNELTYIIGSEYGFTRVADDAPTNTIGNPSGTPACNEITSVPTGLDPASVELVQGSFALGGTTVTLLTPSTTPSSPTTPYNLGSAVGHLITGAGITAGTTITAVSGNTLTISNPTTTSSSGGPLNVAGLLDYYQE